MAQLMDPKNASYKDVFAIATELRIGNKQTEHSTFDADVRAALDKVAESMPAKAQIAVKRGDQMWLLANKNGPTVPAHEPCKTASSVYKLAHEASTPIILKDGTFEAMKEISDAVVSNNGLLLRIAKDERTTKRFLEHCIVGVIEHLCNESRIAEQGGCFYHPAFPHAVYSNDLIFAPRIVA